MLVYQVRQSFKPGEVTPEEANQIGYDFASRFLKGKHAFFVCTHTDKAHIHNHIYWNAVTLDCKKKFRDFRRSHRAVSRLSDLICTEHQLTNRSVAVPHTTSGTALRENRPIVSSCVLRLMKLWSKSPTTSMRFFRFLLSRALALKMENTSPSFIPTSSKTSECTLWAMNTLRMLSVLSSRGRKPTHRKSGEQYGAPTEHKALSTFKPSSPQARARVIVVGLQLRT